MKRIHFSSDLWNLAYCYGIHFSIFFAEEQLETINAEGELSAERQTQSAVEHKTASTLQKS